MTTENGWIETDHTTKKEYLGGLIIASISYAISGNRGYVLHINRRTFKKRFASPDNAKIVADRYVANKVSEHITEQGIKMKVIIGNIPDGAKFDWVVEQMKRMLGDEITIEQAGV